MDFFVIRQSTLEANIAGTTRNGSPLDDGYGTHSFTCNTTGGCYLLGQGIDQLEESGLGHGGLGQFGKWGWRLLHQLSSCTIDS